MIDAYVWTTPNGFRLLIALEELELPYTLHWVRLRAREQKTPEFLAINPNGKIPALVDHDGPDGQRVAVFDSGAILTYLGEKTGRLLPASGAARYETLSWLFFGASGVGPTGGQFVRGARAGNEDEAIGRLRAEAERLLGVMEGRLIESPYLCGDLSMADIMSFPWVRALGNGCGIDLARYPGVERWVAAISARPAVQRADALRPPAPPP